MITTNSTPQQQPTQVHTYGAYTSFTRYLRSLAADYRPGERHPHFTEANHPYYYSGKLHSNNANTSQ